MGHPYDTGSSFTRYPSYYVHDAFGHYSGDDAGKREPCFRTIPHTGTDVSPDKRGDTNARIVSPVHGTIVEAGSDADAGLYHIIKHDRYAEWWILGHHSRFEQRNGHVDRGDLIARMGASGGAKGVHLHISVATSLEAARAYVTGWVQYRGGRSVAAWAGQAIRGRDQRLYGLVDPWPLIEREWADEERRIEAEKAARDKAEALAKQGRDDDMIVIKNSDTDNIYTAGQQFLRHETYQPAGYRTAKLLTAQGEIVDLPDGDFREVLNALGIPLAAEDAVLEGKLWSPHAGVVDARTLALD